MENLNEIKKKLNEMLQENKLLIEECDANIEKTEQSIRNANDQLLEGETEVNVDKYNEAKNLLWSANHAKELYLKQRDKLINEPLITKSEYQSMLSKIDKAAKDQQEEQNVRAIELIKKLKGISDESYQTGELANTLLAMLQRKIYREPKGKIQLGDGTSTWSSDKTYSNDKTVNSFYQSKIVGSYLSQRSGEESQVIQRSWL
ncbi:hypothetical protein [Enterococcus casseliflavus]|uniref:hypothetical protein n=1 Tax=Enterococcus casseliflavus TaxID=37734 RepID=UPI0021AE7B5B|nr:hypothetical protein [Enterococcus casseliflavus]